MYDDPLPPPLVFANHVIRQFISHMLAPDMTVHPWDYIAMRVVFRKLGGQWSMIEQGDIHHLELLKDVVLAWGKMPGRVKDSDVVV
jgi:hypothetical protein